MSMDSGRGCKRLTIVSITASILPSSSSNILIALKNANDMLQDVIKAMDKNGDEVIEYDGT